jgi:trk system potassium uptake protein TrkH
MGIYDAFIHTMGTLATGGFSNKNLSIGFYRSSLIEWLTMIFMMAGATNFALHYGFYKTGIKAYTRNEEFRFYILTIVVATIVVAANIYGTHSRGVLEAIRLAGFQVVSIATTTGYATADYTLWPNFAQLVLVLLMLGGGTVGSTAGAIKCVRVLIVLKLLRNEIYRLIHPHAVVPVKLNGKPVPPDVLKGVLSFTILYIMIFFASTAVLSLQGVDIVTAFSSVASCLGGVGPALSLTGPASNYSMLPEFAKVVLMFNMIVGRLELYTLLILFAPSFWRR